MYALCIFIHAIEGHHQIHDPGIQYEPAGQLVDRVAETVAEACTREQCPHTARRAVKAIGQDAADAIRRLLLERRLLKRSVRLGKRRRTGSFGGAQVPEDTTADHRGQIDLVCETAAVLLIRQEIHRERQPTPGEHRDQTVVAECTDETIERHRREMPDDRAECQTEPPCVAKRASRVTSGRIER